MDISYWVSWLRFLDGGRPDGGPVFSDHPVNVVEACQSAIGRNYPAAHSK
jgi:hypothetical protein